MCNTEVRGSINKFQEKQRRYKKGSKDKGGIKSRAGAQLYALSHTARNLRANVPQVSDDMGLYFVINSCREGRSNTPYRLLLRLRRSRDGIPQPGPHALLDKRPLELGHGSDDLEHKPARRRAEIQVVAETDDAVTKALGFLRAALLARQSQDAFNQAKARRPALPATGTRQLRRKSLNNAE